MVSRLRFPAGELRISAEPGFFDVVVVVVVCSRRIMSRSGSAAI